MLKNLAFLLTIICYSSSAMAGNTKTLRKNDINDDSFDKYYQNQSNDPLETMNRIIFKFNTVVDKTLIRPVAIVYRDTVPNYGKERISSVLSNLTEPVTFLNSALQGNVNNTFTSFWRFTINTTFGIGGLFDVASLSGLKHVKEDFGQTLGVYGAKNGGAYLVLPIIGPSNVRDTIGLAADTFSDPFNYIDNDHLIKGRVISSAINTREQLLDLTDEIDRVSLDPYTSIRSMYQQKRINDIKNGNIHSQKSFHKTTTKCKTAK